MIHALMVMWAGLVLTHLVNTPTGDEQLGTTAPMLVFDAVMAAWLAYFYPRPAKGSKNMNS